jgi:excisionase family DNA binding protein
MATGQAPSSLSASTRRHLTPVGTAGSAENWHLLSIREIAEACRLSEKAVRRAINEGELPAVKLRSRLRVTPQDFEAWIASGRRRGGRPELSPRRRAERYAPAGTFRAMIQDDRGAEL